MNTLQRAVRLVDEHLEESVLIFLLIAMTLLTGGQVVMRRLMDAPMTWSEEFCRYCYMWTGFFSIAYCIRKGCSLRINSFVQMLSWRQQKALDLLTHLLALVVYGIFFKMSLTIISKTIVTGQASPAMEIPFYIIYMGPMIGFALSVLRTIQQLILNIRDLIKGAPGDGGGMGVADEAKVYVREALADQSSTQNTHNGR
jgi:TRAP-type C4-dicarboxylate transport system permease small subunit